MDKNDFLMNCFNDYAGQYIVDFLKKKNTKIISGAYLTKEDLAQELLMKLFEKMDKFECKNPKDFKEDNFRQFCFQKFEEDYPQIHKFAKKSNLNMKEVQRF